MKGPFALLIGMTAFFAPWLCRAQGYTITTVAGGGNTIGGDGGPATSALLSPLGVALDAAGNVYITNAISGIDNSLVSKVNPNGIISTLDGTKVTIGGQPAFIDYISPGQVNVQVPSNVGTGSQPVIVTTAAGASSAYPITVNAAQPGLLAPSSSASEGSSTSRRCFPTVRLTFFPRGSSLACPLAERRQEIRSPCMALASAR